MTDGYKSEVHILESEMDQTSGFIRKRKEVVLKGQENTETLLKMAKKEFESDDKKD